MRLQHRSPAWLRWRCVRSRYSTWIKRYPGWHAPGQFYLSIKNPRTSATSSGCRVSAKTKPPQSPATSLQSHQERKCTPCGRAPAQPGGAQRVSTTANQAGPHNPRHHRQQCNPGGMTGWKRVRIEWNGTACPIPRKERLRRTSNLMPITRATIMRMPPASMADRRRHSPALANQTMNSPASQGEIAGMRRDYRPMRRGHRFEDAQPVGESFIPFRRGGCKTVKPRKSVIRPARSALSRSSWCGLSTSIPTSAYGETITFPGCPIVYWRSFPPAAGKPWCGEEQNRGVKAEQGGLVGELLRAAVSLTESGLDCSITWGRKPSRPRRSIPHPSSCRCKTGRNWGTAFPSLP